MARPTCVFCGRSDVTFNVFTPRFPPFGTACTECEDRLPEGTTVPDEQRLAELQEQSMVQGRAQRIAAERKRRG